MQKEIGIRRPFPLLEQLPDTLNGVILDYLWDPVKLHALTGLQEVVVSVLTLAWHFELPFWMDDTRPFSVRPCDVAADRCRYAAQWKRTMAADLRFPLHGRIDAGGKIIILDGIHRLLKASLIGLPEITVQLLSASELKKIAVLTCRS